MAERVLAVSLAEPAQSPEIWVGVTCPSRIGVRKKSRLNLGGFYDQSYGVFADHDLAGVSRLWGGRGARVEQRDYRPGQTGFRDRRPDRVALPLRNRQHRDRRHRNGDPWPPGRENRKPDGVA